MIAPINLKKSPTYPIMHKAGPTKTIMIVIILSILLSSLIVNIKHTTHITNDIIQCFNSGISKATPKNSFNAKQTKPGARKAKIGPNKRNPQLISPPSFL